MRISRLHIRGLGALMAGETFTFPDPCTVIRGGNETGKTTFTVALLGAFFGLSSEDLLPRDKESRVEVDFSIGSRFYELRRDFQTGRVFLAETSSGGSRILFEGETQPYERGRKYRDIIGSLVGLGEGTAWACAGLVQDGELETHLEDSVRGWLAGNPRASYEQTLGRWRARRETLTREGAGELEEIGGELVSRELDGERWLESATRLLTATRVLEEKEALVVDHEDEAASAEEMLQNVVRFQQLTQERSRLEDSLLELRQERDQIRRHVEDGERGEARLQEEFEAFIDAPTDLEDRIQDWVDAVHRLRALEENLGQTLSEIARLPVLHTRRNGLFLSAVLAFLTWVGCFSMGTPILALFLFPAAILLGTGTIWLQDRTRAQYRTEREQTRGVLVTERDHCRQEEKGARQELGALGRYQNPEKLRRKFRRYLEARESLERARSVCASHRSLSTVMNSYEEVFSELQVLDTQTRDLVAQAGYLAGLDATPDAILSKMEEAQRVKETALAEAERVRRELEELRAERERLEENTPEPGRLTEDVERLRNRVGELSREAIALEEAESALEKALSAYGEAYLDRVIHRASGFVRHLTGGRYEAFRFSEGGEPEVQIGSQWLGLRSLSRETRDQLHFVLRLALHQEVSGPRALPLVLDEAFLGWDDERLERARELVEEAVSSGHQAIILSADPRLAGWGPRVITLGGGDGPSPEVTAKAA